MSAQPTDRASSDAATVLLADDDPLVRRAFERALRLSGNTVVQAENGRQAAELARTRHFDVMVSDIRMPDMNGIQLLRSVRERDLDIPVILVTGEPDVATAAEAIALGAFRYLTKPVDNATLIDLVRQGANLHRIARFKREAFALLGQEGLPADRAGLEARFEEALDTLWMAYQPIVRAADRSLYGYEALLRTTAAGFPHPGAILDAAEKLRRLHDLGRKIRALAAEPMSDPATTGLILFVNVHPSDLLDDDLFSTSAPLCGIAHRVVLEITERSSLTDVSDVRDRVARLRKLGFRVAIDDLGAGYAGLTSFEQLEPEVVKIDMSLVRGVHASPMKRKLIQSITDLCRGMNMLVVGEGVETAAERDTLVDLGCDLLQGYLFTKPGKAFPAWTWGLDQ